MNRFAVHIATCGGVGYLPVAPGTWASMLVVLPAFVLSPMVGWWFYLILTAVSLVLGFASMNQAQQTLGHDPSAVVIDEVAGMSLVCLLPDVLQSPWWCIAGFLLFRVFDIVKPWPANRINDRTEGWAVMVDDIVASIYTIVVLVLAVFTVQTAVLFVGSP